MSLWIDVLGGWYDHAIEELQRLIRSCSEDLWLQNMWEAKPSDRVLKLDPSLGTANGDRSSQERILFLGATWHVVHHTIEALDSYLSPVVPFEPLVDLSARQDADGFPSTPYTKDEMLGYLALCRVKARDTFASLTDAEAAVTRTDEPFASALVRGLMHIREHTGQLGLFLGLEATG